MLSLWCRQLGLNQWPRDYQSRTLPTELCLQKFPKRFFVLGLRSDSPSRCSQDMLPAFIKLFIFIQSPGCNTSRFSRAQERIVPAMGLCSRLSYHPWLNTNVHQKQYSYEFFTVFPFAQTARTICSFPSICYWLWWILPGSNWWPPACKAGALPNWAKNPYGKKSNELRIYSFIATA